MILIALITAVLLTGSFGEGFTECSFNESEETLCVAAAGKSLLFYLLNKDFVDLRLLKDNNSRIFKTETTGSIKIDDPYVNTTIYFTNGTIKLCNISQKDSGVYTLEEFASDGKRLRKSIVHLKILAPVSVLTVSQQCLSPEQQKVTCFYEGDEAELTLTLNGLLLLPSNKHSQSLNNDTSDRSSVFNVSIIIHGQIFGDITCKVWNDVSRDETVKTITACNGTVYISNGEMLDKFKSSVCFKSNNILFLSGLQPVYVAAIVTVVTLLLLAALSAALLKICRKQKTITVNAGDAEADVIYTEVKVRKKKRKTEARQKRNVQ